MIELNDIMTALSIQRASLVNTIQEVASGYVGELMGKAAGTAHLKRLGIEEEMLSAERVDAVLKSLQSSLKVLVGDQTAQGAVAEVRRRIGVA